MILSISLLSSLSLLQPDPIVCPWVNSCSAPLFPLPTAPEIFTAEGREERKNIFTEVGLLDSQCKAVSIFMLPRLTLFSISPAFHYTKEYLSNFQKRCFLGLNMSQAPDRMGKEVGNEEWGREKKYYHVTIVIHKLFLNYSFGIHLTQ